MTDLIQVPTRRTFLIGTGAAAAAVTVGLLNQRAVAAPRQFVSPRDRTYSLQGNWAWCSLCWSMFYAGGGFTGQGGCPAQPGSGHANPQGVSFNYSMIYGQGTTGGLPGTPGYQSGDLWCKNCESMFWPGFNGYDACVSERRSHDGHDGTGSFTYAMPVNISGPAYQGGWNICNGCGMYYHSNGGLGTAAGVCYRNSQIGGTTHHTPAGNWPYKAIH
jgi:hypothetical protein